MGRWKESDEIIENCINTNVNIVDNSIYRSIKDNDRNKFKYFGKSSKICTPFRVHNPQNCIVGDYVSILDNARIIILRNTVIQVKHLIEHYPESAERINLDDYIFGEPILEIGEGTQIGRFCLIACSKSIKIGKNVLISDGAFISDNTHRYENLDVPIMFQSVTQGEPVDIGDFTWIGIHVAIMPGVKIGRHCVISANSVITQDIPDYSMVAGNPARVVKKINQVITDNISSRESKVLKNHIGEIYDKSRSYLISSYPQIAHNIDGPIFTNGCIDSFGFLDFLSFIENEFNISINELEVLKRNLSTLEEMVDFILDSQKSAANNELESKNLNENIIPDINEKYSEDEFVKEYNSLTNLNEIDIKHLLLTRHNPDTIAFQFIQGDKVKKYTYGELEKEITRVCCSLKSIGISDNDTVLICSEIAENTYMVIISLLIMGIKFSITYEEIGSDALKYRIHDCSATVVITSSKHFCKIKSADINARRLKIISIDDCADLDLINFNQIVACKDYHFEYKKVPVDRIAFYQYTSGTTGNSKGAIHVFDSIKMHLLTSKYILGLEEGTKYICSASLGWITGIVYALMGPLLTGATNVVFLGQKKYMDWMKVIERFNIEVFYTAPTLVRYLMLEDENKFKKYDLSSLKRVFTIGEALNRECIEWGMKVLNKYIFNTWFQTELGSIIISNNRDCIYSMGKGIPVVEMAFKEDEKGMNVLCIKGNLPSFFKGYLNKEELYKEKFTEEGYYITGDVINEEEDGTYTFVGRDDEIINTAGHLVSPFEIENVIMECDEVLETAVVGAKDYLLYEKVRAYITLKLQLDEDQRKNLFERIRKKTKDKVSAFAVPREIFILDYFPKTNSGKIIRSKLKE